MSITDELRKWWVRWFPVMDEKLHDDFTAIADRIDEQHKKDTLSEYISGYNRGFDAASDEVESADELRERMEREYTKLPVDADKMPIHIGDVMEWSNGSFTVHELKLTEDGWQTWDSEHGYTVHADECIRHVQPDSWERIIQDAVKLGYADYPTTGYEAELVERCKKLAGE